MRSVSSSIVLPVSAASAFRVIADLSTLIRLSPFFTLKHIESAKEGTAQKSDTYSLTIEYYQSKLIETHRVEIEKCELNRLVSFNLGNSILKNIAYELEPAGKGVQLTQTFALDSEDEAVLKGSQGELQLWLNSVGEYIKLAEGKSLLKKARKKFMDKLWLKLSLSERNIALIMIKISVLELVLLLVLVLIWNIANSV